MKKQNFRVDFILTERNVPLLAIEVKSGRMKNIPDANLLAKKGIGCKLLIVSPHNMEEFFQTTSMEEILTIGDNSL